MVQRNLAQIPRNCYQIIIFHHRINALCKWLFSLQRADEEECGAISLFKARNCSDLHGPYVTHTHIVSH